jgi:hypothetical protein
MLQAGSRDYPVRSLRRLLRKIISPFFASLIKEPR